MSETQTAMYYNGNWYGRSGNTDALDARITQTANNIAPKQATNTASKLITVGEYFTNANGNLCVCDVQIASGGSIVVDSNCHVVSEGLGNELKEGGLKYFDISLGNYTFTWVQDSAGYGARIPIDASEIPSDFHQFMFVTILPGSWTYGQVPIAYTHAIFIFSSVNTVTYSNNYKLRIWYI